MESKEPDLKETLDALVGVAAVVALQLGRKYAREHPDSIDVVIGALKGGAPMEARVRLSPTPNVDLVITTASGEELVIASGLFRPKGGAPIFN